MRAIQPPSKLQLLQTQRKKRSRGPALGLAALLTLVTAWNVRVIASRYGDPGPEAGAAPAAQPVAEALPGEADDPDASGALQGGTAPEAQAADLAPGDVALALDAPEGELALAPVEVPAPAAPAHPASVPEATDALPPTGILTPVAASAVLGADEAVAFHTVTGRLKRNNTVGQALADAGLTGEQIHGIVGALKGVFDFRKARPGQGFRVKTTPEGLVEFFEYETSPVESYCAKREGDALVGYKREIPVETRVEVARGTIHSSLYESMSAIGEGSALAMLLADVLAWDIDFYRDTRVGDTFDIVVEKRLYKGKLLGYGEVLAARYKGGVGTYEIFRHEQDDGRVAYYDRDGKSAQKALLKAPLKVARVTSRYGQRRHPVLGYSKMHAGVDYGAPTGTPVWAVGDGTVVQAGWKGANGKLIGLRHTNGYTTWYAHLSAINVRSGQRVRQKQVIGRVGSTGRSTGPHLHYAVKQHGRHINPLALKLPPREPLAKDQLPAFQERIAPYLRLFDQGDMSLVSTVPHEAAAAQE